MATTLSDLRTETYTILNEPSTSELYSSDFVDVELNNVQVEICDGQDLKFLRTSTTFLAPVKSSLSSAITTISTVISVPSTTNWDSVGSVWIDGDIVAYTGKTSTTLTGVTGITVNHDEGCQVYPLKSLPSDYWKTPELKIKKNTVTILDSWRYYDELEWDKRLSAYSYTLVYDNNTGFLLIDGVSTSDVCVFYYQKYPTYMDDDADNATIPDPYAKKILPTLAASRCMLLRGDDLDGLGSKLNMLGQQDLFRFYKHYGNAEDSYRKIISCDYKSRQPRSVRQRRKTNYYY